MRAKQGSMDVAKRFEIIRPIGGHLIVLDRSTGVAKEMAEPHERDFWLHGVKEVTHAKSVEAFYGGVNRNRKA